MDVSVIDFECKLFSCIRTAERHSGAVNLNHTYEKIRFVINHTPNWHRICSFLHATAGDKCNFDHRGNGQGLAIAIADKEEEDHGQEEGCYRSVAFAR
ncbi:MAG: hypothetical protein DME91_01695 [Verrucomicrobia bacterium]|nr:MAG: hypothetical protein DME91_01695 [Verrucomicrobiota bacterium]PYJ47536.1 MAG: hypothetical protein DME85_05005 [Verrucomicrobiota bacterium]PYK64338.1 MAG: hypothetical protein DME50_14085 [Verrucomicrobiota bacterium]